MIYYTHFLRGTSSIIQFAVAQVYVSILGCTGCRVFLEIPKLLSLLSSFLVVFLNLKLRPCNWCCLLFLKEAVSTKQYCVGKTFPLLLFLVSTYQPSKRLLPVIHFFQVLVRFPTGERKERRFCSSATIQSLYDYVDSLECLKAEKYCLVSNFPRVVFGPEKHSLSLKEAGLHPQASLFIEVDAWEANLSIMILLYPVLGTWNGNLLFSSAFHFGRGWS